MLRRNELVSVVARVLLDNYDEVRAVDRQAVAREIVQKVLDLVMKDKRTT